jgi:hypothetical protein
MVTTRVKPRGHFYEWQHARSPTYPRVFVDISQGLEHKQHFIFNSLHDLAALPFYYANHNGDQDEKADQGNWCN